MFPCYWVILMMFVSITILMMISIIHESVYIKSPSSPSPSLRKPLKDFYLNWME
uniref:ATP synthase F0 subunit 8 n=1 Tax=Goniodes dissimilis TaxID=186210 RepID=A0A9E9F207_9NEOP|nr:ATP synthase F0 subunit 8 [Goniodes dissimilis]